MDAIELKEARDWVDGLIEEAKAFSNKPIPVEHEARQAYGHRAASLRERLHGAGMSAFVLDYSGGYRLDEINKLIETLASVGRHLDTSRPQLSDDAAALPQPSPAAPSTGVEI